MPNPDNRPLVLVTGASGFLGSYLTRALSRQGEKVLALYHSHEPAAFLKELPGVTWQCCDLLDVYAVAAVMEGISRVYHCAAIVSFSPEHREQMLHFNISSTAHVADEALNAGVEKLLHFSSIASLGRSTSGEKIHEESTWEDSRNNSSYAISKQAAEMEVWRAIGEGLNAAVLNPGIILGAPLNGNWSSGSAALIPVVAKSFPFYTQGINAFTGVEDAVHAAILLMNSQVSAERFIISTGNFSYREIFNMMAAALNVKPPHIAAGPFLTSLVWRWYGLKKKLGGGPATITRESARNAQLQCEYSNEKFLQHFTGFRYRSMEETISEIAESYMKNAPDLTPKKGRKMTIST